MPRPALAHSFGGAPDVSQRTQNRSRQLPPLRGYAKGFAAGASLEKCDPEPPLQLPQMPAHRRMRYMKLARGGSHPVSLDGESEGAHGIERQLIHGLNYRPLVAAR